MSGVSPVVASIILLNVLFSWKGFQDDVFFSKYKFQIKGIQNGEHIRMLSSAFLHVDTQHLLFNMITLYFFADTVINSVGVLSFLGIYFGSLLIGNFLSLRFHRSNPHYSAVGASGAVTGILFSAILLFPEMKILIMFIPIPVQGYIFAAGYFLYTLYGMKSQNDTIGHAAHFGGAFGGVVLTLMCRPNLFYESKLTLAILTIIAMIAFFLFKRHR